MKLTLLASLVGTSLVLPQVTIQAQTDEAAMEACPIMVGGEVIDTESTLYPTISYELIDANLPADREKSMHRHCFRMTGQSVMEIMKPMLIIKIY